MNSFLRSSSSACITTFKIQLALNQFASHVDVSPLLVLLPILHDLPAIHHLHISTTDGCAFHTLDPLLRELTISHTGEEIIPRLQELHIIASVIAVSCQVLQGFVESRCLPREENVRSVNERVTPFTLRTVFLNEVIVLESDGCGSSEDGQQVAEALRWLVDAEQTGMLTYNAWQDSWTDSPSQWCAV